MNDRTKEQCPFDGKHISSMARAACTACNPNEVGFVTMTDRTKDSRVSRDPNASEAEKMANKAHDPVIVLNHLMDPTYAPYCMRCDGMHRMRVVEPFLWDHTCGAIHDERQVLT